MDQPMPGQEQEAPPADDKAGAGDPIQIAQGVAEGLAKLGDMLNASQGASDDEKAQMSQIISLFGDLVQKKLGGAPGDDPQAAPAPMSADGGPQGVPMGPQGRM